MRVKRQPYAEVQTLCQLYIQLHVACLIYIYIFTAADSAEYMEVATMDAVLKYQDDEGMSQNMSKAITIVCHYFVE